MAQKDTFLDRAGGSIAKFTGKSLAEIKLTTFAEQREFVLLFLEFLRGLKETGYGPDEAKSLVDTFLYFTAAPQVIASGTLGIGGQIRTVAETELGLDIGIEFALPEIPFAGASAGLDLGFGYRKLEHEATSQNFKSTIQWFRSSGPQRISPESLAAVVEKVLTDKDLAIPDVDEEKVNQPADLLTAELLPFLVGIFKKDTQPTD